MYARSLAGRGSLIAALIAVGLAVQVAQPLSAQAATPPSPTKAVSPSATPTSSPTQHPSPTPSPTSSPKSTSSPSTSKTKVAGSPKTASAPIIPSGGSSTYSSAVLADGPAAYYRLGETSGTTAADSSGNGYNGTISGTVTLGSPGALPNDTDASMNFGGGMVQTPHDMTNITALTEEVWVKTTDAGSWRTLFWDGGGSAPSFILGLSSGYCNQTVGAPFLYLGAPNLYVGIHGRTPINDGKWHYLAGVFSGASGQQITTSQMKLYVDGVPVPTDACNQGSASANAPISGSGGTRIPYAGDFNGYLDEAAIYTKALSQTQLTNHIAASGNLPGPPTIGTPSGGANQATAAWTAPANSGGDSLTGYLVSAFSGSSGVNSISVGAQATSAPVTGLAAGTAYTFQVRAINRFGVGAASASSTSVTPTGAASTYASTVLGDHPSGYWRLGDSGPVFADSSGNLNLGGPTGSVTQGAGGGLPNDSDKAVTLAASSSVSTNYVQPNVTAYTAEAWVNTTTTAQWATLVDDRGTPDTAHTLTLGLNNSVCSGVAGAPFFALDAAGIFVGIQTSKAVNDGKWHHIVGTWSAPSGTAVAPGQFAVYVDGVAISGNSCTTGSANSPLSGIIGTAVGAGIVGSVDDVATYTSALSASQIAAHWAASGWPPGAPGNIAARAATNSAVVSWSKPSYAGQSAITSYVVSALSNGASAATETVDASTLSVNMHGLAANTSYTFSVAGQNSYGTGVLGSSSSVAIPANTMPAPGATDTVFGNYFAWRGGGFTPFSAGTSGVVSQTSLPAMSTWTVEFWMRNYGGFATSGSAAGFGIMGGQTPNSPRTVNAGLTADSGSGLHVTYPGGRSP